MFQFKDYEPGFENPWMLLLLVLLIPMWLLSFNSLSGLGGTRRVLALLLRTAVFSLLVFALAETSWNRKTDKLTVFYLLDQSESIPKVEREQMLRFVFESVQNHRRSDKGDKAAVIVFGANARIESPPYEGELPLIDKIESDTGLKSDATSLEAALKLAKASFPEDTARRIVIVSDGNENLGDSLQVARSLVQDGVSIDVVPIELLATGEVSVDKILIPSDIRKNQAFEARIVLSNHNEPSDQLPGGKVKGKLRLNQRIGDREEFVSEIPVELDPGKNVFTFKHEIDQSAVVTFNTTFIPDTEYGLTDAISKNNEASAFTHIRGEGRILMIEDSESNGEFQQMIERLRTGGIEVDLMSTDSLFTTPAELLQYDSIVLANVSRASDTGTDVPVGFSDDQIRMLVANCEELGCGLVMLGGERSFGAGGWSNTELEKAMPVDFQIKNDKINAVGALALMMHASEMDQGNFWQNKVAREAIRVLGPMDYCGMVDWSDYGGNPKWLWKMPDGVDQVNERRDRMLAMVGRMTPGDMPDFNAPMQLALSGLVKSPASMKHMIIISDGDPTPPTNALIQKFKDANIRISTVAVGTHGPAGSTPLKDLANKTGGKYYEVKDPRALPRIYQREARRVAKPVIKVSEAGMSLLKLPAADRNEMMTGIKPEEMPRFFGYVMTTVKENPLVEQLLVASDPPGNTENSTVLAAWRYGVGRAIAFTSDGGHQWTSEWYQSEYYDKFFTQMIRYSMRPVTQSANFAISTDVRDNRARVVVSALNEEDDFINFLNVHARGINPSMEGFDLEFSQTAPGRYVAEFDAESSGNYLFSIFPGEGYERLTTGISVPWSNEYSDRQTNMALLQSISSLTTPAGIAGLEATGGIFPASNDTALKLNPFRPGLAQTVSIETMWPFLLVLCGLTLAGDVFIRRVSIPIVEMTQKAWGFITRSKDDGAEARAASIERLKSRKSEIDKEVESKRAQVRFTPGEEQLTGSGRDQLAKVLASERERELESPIAKVVEDPAKVKKEDAEYTSRLLDAKRKAQKRRDQGSDM